MIQLLASRYSKHIACFFIVFLYLSIVIPSHTNATNSIAVGRGRYYPNEHNTLNTPAPVSDFAAKSSIKTSQKSTSLITNVSARPVSVDIDGPSQPEMSSFKPAGTSDMVNLFTGDFSYNIPLLDVGGYPVNIYYNGGIGMEQEASWVGLGWNINPGNVNRNMRGVPDDFNGEEKLIQEQNMKKNVTWGMSLGMDLELQGRKELKAFTGSVGISMGFSVNNYLGPSIELGLKGGTSFSVSGKGISEKGPVGVSMGLSANLSTRGGLTFTPNVSLSAQSYIKGGRLSTGVGLSTSYNSRSGVKGLQLSGSTSLSYTNVEGRNDKEKITGKPVNNSSFNMNLFSSFLSFAKPTYIPVVRTVITNSSGAGRFQLGSGMFGIYPSLELEGYGQVSSIEAADRRLEKPMVGYLYAEKAKNNRNAVMDFTRFNDQEVTPTTSVISVPQYAYDVFFIQGEGTGGTIRAYRNDNGYVRDNYTVSRDKSFSAGVDLGLPGHVGANFNTVKTPSVIGEWDAGNQLRVAMGFNASQGDRENVYFRNPGETSVLHPNQYDSIGGTSLVRYKLGGSGFFPTVEPVLQKFSENGLVTGESPVQRGTGIAERKKRTQVTSFLSAEEASKAGLDTMIRSYDRFVLLDNNKNLRYDTIRRTADYRKKHHISQVNVTEADGKRYVYGVPVYNTRQKDFSFTVADDCADCDTVGFSSGEASLNSTHINSGVGGKDGYVQTTETPPYAHSFLLSGLLSPDYVDLTGDGITEDDLGGAVKFNYSKVGIHKWRTPLTTTMQANSNPGNLSEKRDDKGIVSYGERESWYLHSIESKTMIAVFKLENRSDGKGARDSLSGVNGSDSSIKLLRKIDLFNKADLKKNGVAGAKPIKTVHFDYNYSLCDNTPDNTGEGKLTLAKIWFTYNGQERTNKNQYVFSYASGSGNPSYAMNASDRWGTYKPHMENPDDMMNKDYPYSIQDKTKADQYAGSWALKKILLPSGGQLEVEYESDDYAFVQNKRAAVMSGIIGFSNSNSDPVDRLYSVNGSSITENDYVFISVPQACSNKQEVYQKYLQGMSQLAVKLSISMPKGVEILTSYANISDYGVYSGGSGPAIWIKMAKVNGYSPLSQTAIEFLRQQLPGQAFPGYDVSDGGAFDQLLEMLKGWLTAIKSAFSDIPVYLRKEGLARGVEVDRSFARLNDPDGFKYGGGHRVKKIILKDNWQRMTGQYTSVYGQEYDYTTKETFNGTERTISSGIASYEPSIGGEENPFLTIVQIAKEVPLGPTSYGAIEMPVMDAFFPAPLVGYSKVTVTSIGKKQNQDTTKKTRSGVGRQVTEFYTAKDFPVYYDHTPIEPASNLEEHINPTLSFLYKYAFDSRAISQGFLVATNNMHGKMKSQSSYAENDPATRINFTQNFYRNTGARGLDEKFDFIYNNLSGEIKQGNMGIDIELMTDTREFSLKSNSLEVQGQVDWMLPAPFPLWLPFVWFVVNESENTYRAVTTTKVISYQAVLDSVVVIDKGSQVSTKNMVYDAETGQVVINRTNNEFDKPVYSVNYPAYWGYSGMGLAYKNIDAVYSNVNFLGGKITSNNVPETIFESGDELYLVNTGSIPSSGCGAAMVSPPRSLLWAIDTNKNKLMGLTNPDPDFVFVDSAGKPYTRNGVKFRIIRSGKRNMLGAPAASVVQMTNPVIIELGVRKLKIDEDSKVINASAVEYREKWQGDNDLFQRYALLYDTSNCGYTEVPDCEGYLQKNINPYRKGILGNFRGYRNMVFYGDRAETNPGSTTNLPVNGFLSDFGLYWDFNGENNLVPDYANAKWVWNTQANRYNSKGMELETKDALNIYTAAQYGYSKSIPVAIANNSRYQEMAYEGFEDSDYTETLNGAVANECTKRHFDLYNMPYSRVVNTDTAGFNAHTGKYVLAIDPGQTASRQFDVKLFAADTASLLYGKDTIKGLMDPGANAVITATTPIIHDMNVTVSGLDGAMELNVDPGNDTVLCNYPTTGKYTRHYYYYITTSHYIEIKQNGKYIISTSSNRVNIPPPGEEISSVNNISFSISVMSMTGSHPLPRQVSGPGGTSGPAGRQFEYCLPIGIYKIEGYAFGERKLEFGLSCPMPGIVLDKPHDVFGISVTYNDETILDSYKSMLSSNECIYTKAPAATEALINPVFAIPPEKKMVFSAWVKEKCGNPGAGVPCKKDLYTDNKVELQFNDGTSQLNSFNPTGTIVEGWQRYEGYFTAPADATTMTLKFINSSTDTVYYDDIRIHPFNANMKGYVYDPVNLRLVSQLDANNYASFYEYDEEGTLIRTKVETKQGIKTISESRSAKQKNITSFE